MRYFQAWEVFGSNDRSKPSDALDHWLQQGRHGLWPWGIQTYPRTDAVRCEGSIQTRTPYGLGGLSGKM
jgi:hypothetical protein